ncbi:MAG: PfkB family carbohydrate kinase [Nitrososphaerales archaeon]
MNRGSAPSFVIAGHAVIDYILDKANQIQPRQSIGGAFSYCWMTLHSLGQRPIPVTKVGGDFPSRYFDIFQKQMDLDLRGFVCPDEKTTSFIIDRTFEPRKMWLTQRCKNLSLVDFKANSLLDSNKALMVGTVAGEISLPLLDRITKEFQHVYLDSQGFVRNFSRKNGEMGLRDGLDISALSGVNFLKADRSEICALSGSKDIGSAISQVSRFVDYIILTAGSEDVKIYEGNKLKLKARPLSVDVVDTTGAGDIFLSVFALADQEGEKIERSLALAVAASSISVEKVGLQKAQFEKSKLEALSKKVLISRS